MLVELIELVNFDIHFLSQMTLFRCLTFLLGSLTVTLTILLFWIYLFLVMLVFVLQWLSLHCFPSILSLTFSQTQNRMARFILQGWPHNKNTLWVTHLFLLSWVKLNLTFFFLDHLRLA